MAEKKKKFGTFLITAKTGLYVHVRLKRTYMKYTTGVQRVVARGSREYTNLSLSIGFDTAGIIGEICNNYSYATLFTTSYYANELPK